MREKLSAGQDAELNAVEEATHTVLGEWIKGHLEDERMSLLEYNPLHYPFQRLDCPHYGPTERSNEPVEAGRIVMGQAFNELVEAMGDYVPTIRSRLENNQNTLIITPHLQNVLDTPLVEAALHGAYEDAHLAKRSVLMSGKVITRLAIFGVPAIEIMSPMGRVYMSVPRSPSAHRAGLGNQTIDSINRRMLGEFLREIRHGRVIHQAPSNQRARIETEADGQPTLVMPRVDETTAKLISKYQAYAIPVALRVGKHPQESGWAIGGPDFIRDPEDLHRMMEELAILGDGLFDDISVVYGQQK